ncbi:primase-helicase family protein [Lacinutrix sp. Bg11-31]|uniref:primase-helicase family protein n=1 Tax=Lacinutrix sp. Bg11-31 TaxID=2057808 RepID=UPI000C31AA8C|nr:primase-helicase family protein [Lacinutrix sp. Bg11-31]AUC82261.1 helicase [Lacinutrix sp. Bg11-31]
MKDTYLRIGTAYYKKVKMPLNSKDTIKLLAPWSKSEIITDHDKEFAKSIPKYDGFCLIPSHTNFEHVINGFYNKYERLDHTLTQGDFPETEKFLKHIFGEQYLIGLDYLSILWKKPMQVLPILCLVSNERNTGKTTFLNWVKLIFQNNMTINNNEDFRSRFNSDWASKLIIAVDEVLLDKREDSERLKNLSTAKTYKSEAKGKDKIEGNFFGKFILCSNNEKNFVYIDNSEIRYWVRKIIPFDLSADKPNLLESLNKELPHFINFINTRKIYSPRKTRMWFTKEQIHTEALDILMNGNKTFLNKELEQILSDEFIQFDTEELKYSVGDLVDKLNKNNIRTNSFKITDLIKNEYQLESKNSTYTKYHMSMTMANNPFVEESKHRGRHYTFTKEMFKDID